MPETFTSDAGGLGQNQANKPPSTSRGAETPRKFF